MAETSVEEMRKLVPGERIKKLKELQEKNKKEIEEADKLIGETEQQISRDRFLEQVAVPEQHEVDITRLFRGEGEVPFKLEAVAQEDVTSENVRYFVEAAYEGLKEAMSMGEEINPLVVDELGERLQKAKYISTTEEVANLAVASIGIIYKLRKEQREA
ncbi:hypothetical protein HYU13_04135 [Candidatus Woesearchaeota archaeon]|nr:hypothetical protein [Candidatus Woesearchaeota archaeon]